MAISNGVNIAINGFGRIGRAVFKSLLEKKGKINVVCINDLTSPETLAHLLKYDSVYGRYGKNVSFTKDSLTVDGKKIKILAEKNPENLPWKEMDIDIVLECTGRFREKAEANMHIKAGAKKVIISAPAKDSDVRTIVMGVNEEKLNKNDKIVSMASCTTGCYAPITKILHDNFIIERGFMVTAHAVTNDQSILDLPHKDLRRARTVLDNIIPTNSGSDKATAEVIPSLKGKLHTMAMRVPVRVGSVIYAIFDLKKKPSPGEVNKIIKEAAGKRYKNIIKYETAPIVSADVVNQPYSCIFDSLLTEDSDDLIKVVAWYDNEWGYSCRLADLCEYINKKKLI